MPGSIESKHHRAVVGVDVGGTFTDFVATLSDGRLAHHKEPSTPHDPALAVGRGLRALAERYPQFALSGGLLVHGTTIALNAVLQRKVARVALVVSRGTRDVLEIARCRMPSSFDFHVSKEEPLIARERVIEIDARIAADGSVMAQPDEAQIEDMCRQIATMDVQAVAVMLLHSYLAPALEDSVASSIAARLPKLLVSRSAQVWPEIREYERAVAVCLNAQIHPLMDRYLAQLSDILAATQPPPTLLLSTSSGGSLSLRSARERPIETLLSGPASGVMAAVHLMRLADMPSAVTFDMGGTSADMAVLTEGKVTFTTTARVGGLPLMMPVVGVNSIGAGGGSIVSVDTEGVIKVGPESAGARPGPVAFGFGGTQPTVTDCYVVLGLIDPGAFLGGRLTLDRAAAEAALVPIAERIGVPTVAHAAEAALKVATARMAAELFKLLAQQGLEPARYVLVPFGGAGPTHAVRLVEEAGLLGAAVPPAAATFCALGAALADVRRDFVRSFRPVRLATLGRTLWDTWSTLEAEARDWLAQENVPLIGHQLSYAIDMRYAGQSHNLEVVVPASVRQEQSVHGVAEAFHTLHESIYDFREDDAAVEIVTQRLSIRGQMPPIDLPAIEEGQPPVRASSRPVFNDGAWLDAAVYTRDGLSLGTRLEGPAIIEQEDTTTWLPPGWCVAVDRTGVLLISRSDAHAA
jgi:N-methylhydantoinase A